MAVELPIWWDWDLEFTGHLLRRMVDRQFTETDLRAILADVEALEPSETKGRWVASGSLHGQAWRVVVEPDEQENCVLVITAYHVE